MIFSNRNRTLSAVLLAAASFTLPTIANAQSYNGQSYAYTDCRRSDKKNQLAGGLLGAAAGAIIGSQVSGNGARTEGSAIGAVLGGAAGVGIGGDMRNCGKETSRYSNTGQVYSSSGTSHGSNSGYQSSTYSTQTYPRQTYPSHTVHTTPTYSTTGYHTTTSQPYTTVYTSPTQTHYGHSERSYQTVSSPRYSGTSHYGGPVSGQSFGRLERISQRISVLREERERINRRRYAHYDHHADQRLREIGQEIRRLKDRKRRIVKRNRKSSTHYHGNQACYSTH